MRKGLTLANRQWDPYTDAEMAALVDLAPDTIAWLLYDNLIDQTHAEQLRPFIEAHHPTILYRPYRDDIPTLDPATWAMRCDQMIAAVGYAGELLPDNERNLPVEHGSENWTDHITWLKAFAKQWRLIQPHTPLHLSALSPSGDWASGLWEYHKAGVDVLFDRIDVHAYGPQAAEIVSITSTILLGPIDVTEFNQIDPIAFDNAEPPCHSATWFLLGGTPDQAAYDILTQPTYYASFKAMRNTPSTGGNTVATFTVGQGVKDLMAKHGDSPKSDEHYVVDATGQTFKSETFGSKGLYQWNKQANETVLIPFG